MTPLRKSEVVFDKNLPFVGHVKIRSNDMDSPFGPFGGGWKTKFSLLIGTSRNVIEFWRWTISFYGKDS